ncbi:hypothetical protein ACFLU8_03010 [Chloroflexota bacterium]
MTYRCFDCGLDFYGEEPQDGITDEIMADGHIIDDEEALCAAEEEIERQVDEDEDRRYIPLQYTGVICDHSMTIKALGH